MRQQNNCVISPLRDQLEMHVARSSQGFVYGIFSSGRKNHKGTDADNNCERGKNLQQRLSLLAPVKTSKTHVPEVLTTH